MKNNNTKGTFSVKRILVVLIYIEDHIEDELTTKELSKVACYSPYHFHRIFQVIVGETVHKYVRRLRLEKAAGRLQYTNQPITDIALDTKFDTPSAFTRAFRQCMGTSPRNFRLLYTEVNRMTKKISDLPIIDPEKIEKIADINILFIRRCGSYDTSAESAFHAMRAFIQENKLDEAKLRHFCLTHDDPQIAKEDTLRLDACIQAPAGISESGEVGRKILKGGKYAIFTHYGSHSTIGETLDRILLKWLPNSTENFDDTRLFFSELFNLEHVDKDESKLITKIYIPVA